MTTVDRVPHVGRDGRFAAMPHVGVGQAGVNWSRELIACAREMFGRLLRAETRGRAARTVELFGWLVLAEGALTLVTPHLVVAVLHIPALSEQAGSFFRLVGVLASGLGILYVVSGRLGAEGFVFASLLDRPLVPPLMAVLWMLGLVPSTLALVFALQDLGGFLWTLAAWNAQRRG